MSDINPQKQTSQNPSASAAANPPAQMQGAQTQNAGIPPVSGGGSSPATSGNSSGNPADDLAAKIKEIESKYTIFQPVKEKYPDLIALVLQTESMNDDERDYWFQILPIMTDEQIAKFHGILTNERNQLKKLDQEYEAQMKKLNDKHQREWTEFEVRKKREAIQKAEAKTEAQEKAQEEELLKKLGEA